MLANPSKTVKLAGLVAILVLALILPTDSFPSQIPPIVKTGVLLPFSGALDMFGPPFRNTVNLAANQCNQAANRVFGGPIIRMVFEDSGTDPAQGVDRARKLVNVDGVPVIIGALSSGVSSAVAESVTIPANVLQISPASTSPIFSTPPFDKTFFRTTASDALQAEVAAQLAPGEIVPWYRQETASIMFVNNPYGQGIADVFEREFEARGGRVLAKVPHPSTPEPTYVDDLERALRGDPDIVLVASYSGAATVFMREALEQFNFMSFQHTDGTMSQDIIEALGTENVEGQLGTALPGSDPGREEFQRFSAAYEEAYGESPPLPFMDSAYDAAVITCLTVATAVSHGLSGGETDGRVLIDRIRQVSNPPGSVVGVGAENVEDALLLITAGEDVDYVGAAGEQDFDENGDVDQPVEIWQYTQRGIETVTTICAGCFADCEKNSWGDAV